MPSFLADHDIEGHFRLIFDQVRGPYWSEIAEALDIHSLTFADLGIPKAAPDREVWHECQRSGLVLVPGNRNLDGLDALESVIREETAAERFPVLTISDVSAIYPDPDYLRRVVARLMEYALELEDYRGAGRLYLP